MAPIRLGIVGVGKIVRDQHLPALAKSDDFDLLAAASRNATVEGLANFKTLEAMLAEGPALDAVALCMPPQVRFQAAALALKQGKHVFLEKPPGATASEVAILESMAADAGVSLYASWHSRHAGAVEETRRLLAQDPPRAVRVAWKEDVERWHPGQEWIWQPGGLGVFDPGINALSILTRILPDPLILTESRLLFPANRQAPVAADLAFVDSTGLRVTAAFDWRQKGPQSWDIEIETAKRKLLLGEGGSRLDIDGFRGTPHSDWEYAGLYAEFARLIRAGTSDVDVAPLRLVADAFLNGGIERTDAI